MRKNPARMQSRWRRSGPVEQAGAMSQARSALQPVMRSVLLRRFLFCSALPLAWAACHGGASAPGPAPEPGTTHVAASPPPASAAPSVVEPAKPAVAKPGGAAPPAAAPPATAPPGEAEGADFIADAQL